MSIINGLFALIAVAAIIEWCVRWMAWNQRKVKPGISRAPNPDRSCRRWDSHETEPKGRYIP